MPTTRKKAAAKPAPAATPPAVVDTPRDPKDGAFEIRPAVLQRFIRSITPAASTDEARPILTGIYLDCDLERLIMAATDSYRLYRITARADMLAATAPVPCRALIPRAWLLRLAQALSTFGSAPPIKMRVTPNASGRIEALFDAKDGRQEAMSTETIRGDYPHFEQMIATYASSTAMTYPVAFNPRYFADMLRSSNVFAGGADSPRPVRIRTMDPLKASIFEQHDVDGNRLEMMLMPVRVPDAPKPMP